MALSLKVCLNQLGEWPGNEQTRHILMFKTYYAALSGPALLGEGTGGFAPGY